jgi:hypothetical protein
MAPMPPPPQKGGSNIAMIILIVVVAFMVLGGGGCAMCLCIGARAAKKAADTTSDPVKTVKTPASTPAAANTNWITAEHPFVKFLAPAGWSTDITPDKEWGIFKSPARDAVLAFTTFSRPGESTTRLGKAANVLGVTDISWNAPRYGTLGKEGFSDHYADGSCNFKGPNGYIWYATVNPGNDDHQILLIFTVNANAPQARRKEAQAAIDSLQHRP